MRRENHVLRLVAKLLGLIGVIAATGAGALGQPLGSSAVVGDVPTPVEITMSSVNTDVQCGPPRVRLPAQDRLDLRVINHAETPLMFAAPQFFTASQHIESAGFVVDLVKGGFIVAPKSTARVLMRTPIPGEYYFSCFQPGNIPNPASSGFLIVVPAAT